MFHQIFQTTARKGEACESVSEHVDEEERGGCELKQGVRSQQPLVLFPALRDIEGVPALFPDPVNWVSDRSPPLSPKGNENPRR